MFTKDLKQLSKELREEFENNSPFAHIYIDNLFDENILQSAVDEIPSTLGIQKDYRDKYQIKELTEGRALIEDSPENIKKVFKALNSLEFVSFLQELTGIEDLFPDDTFRGGGIHKISKGGMLGIHVDFSRPAWNENVYRRANVLLYLNKNWKDQYEGHLELWNEHKRNGGKCIKKIAPVFNRLIIFGTKKESWHGHPTPLNTPDNMQRLSFASYYYSNNPSDDLKKHSTIF